MIDESLTDFQLAQLAEAFDIQLDEPALELDEPDVAQILKHRKE